jgi:tyrosyl-tRNA synthetase
MFGKVLSIPDAAMPSWYDLLLGSPPPEGESPRDQKRALARAIVTRYHGPEAAASAEAHFDRVHVAREVPDDIPTLQLPDGAETGANLPELLGDELGMSALRRAGARSGQGGVRLRPASRSSSSTSPPRASPAGVLQVGKRRFFRLVAAT